MNHSEDVSISPFFAVFIGCLSALIFALFIIFCKLYYSQIKKKKDTFIGFATKSPTKRDQHIESTFENCEYSNCCKDCKDNQVSCNCDYNNSNNNSNSVSADPEVDSNSALIFNSRKHNDSQLDAISIEKGFDLTKSNLIIGQNSLDVASLDEIINEELIGVEQFNKNDIELKLNENKNQSFEIIRPEEKQSEQSNEKPIKVILKLHRNLPLKLHSQSIEIINEKPSKRKLLRRASLNINGGLVRQKSFEDFDEEVCQNTIDANTVKESLTPVEREFTKEHTEQYSREDNITTTRQKSSIKPDKVSGEKTVLNAQLNTVRGEEHFILNPNSDYEEHGSEMDRPMINSTNEADNVAVETKLNDSSSHHLRSVSDSEENDRKDYQGSDYIEIWKLRTTIEAEVDKDLTDSCGDLSEISNLVKQRSTENNEEHELITNIIKSSSSDQRLSKNDSGYKSIERSRDYSIDSKSDSMFRQFTGNSLSKEHSLGSISNQNISLCSSNSINLDVNVNNYKNQYTIKEEDDTNEKKITFV